MSDLAWMKTTGLDVRLGPDGQVRISGLAALAPDVKARVLDVARTHKTAIVAELRGQASASPVAPDLPALKALARFEVNPHGVVHWLAWQPIGTGKTRSPEIQRRFQACIRAEARLRLEEATHG